MHKSTLTVHGAVAFLEEHASTLAEFGEGIMGESSNGQPHTALVLSGGGSRGAFQLGALEVLAEAGYTYTCVAGVSVGALNGTMVAGGQLDRLGTLWRTITREDVFTGRWPWVLFNVLRGRRGLYDNSPLLELIRREVDPEGIDIPLEIGVVKLESGQYLPIRPNSPRFRELVFASTIIPIIWPPYEAGGDSFVDGGLRNITPLGNVVNHEPDRIIIITAEPRDKPPASMSLDTIVDVARRSLDVLLDETFKNDIRSFLRINRLVKQAADRDVTLRRPNGRAYQFFEHLIIEPEKPLGSGLDFSRSSLDAWIARGRAAAERALGNAPPPV
jgi:NTE family protein